MNYHKCPISRSSLPPQHLENQVQFRQRADFFSPPWPPALEVVWQAQMPPLPPSPTSPETTRSFSDGCFCELIFAKDFPFLKLWKSPSTSYTAHDFSFFNKYFYNPYHPNSSPSKHFFYPQYTYFFCPFSALPSDGLSPSEWTVRTPPAPASLPWPSPAPFRAPLVMQPSFCLPIQSHAHSFPSFLLHFHTMLFVTLSYVLASDLSTASKPRFPLRCLLPFQIFTDHMCIWTVHRDLDVAISTWTCRSVRLSLMIQKHNLDIKYSTCVVRKMTYHKGNKAPQFLTPFPISFSK